jgi:hypothetical protein
MRDTKNNRKKDSKNKSTTEVVVVGATGSIISFPIFKIEMRKFIMTSRFNNSTFRENTIYRENKKVGCIYCSPSQTSKQVFPDALMFVLEMNNEINEIMGVGLVKNHAICGKYRVYENGNYNRYVYVGRYRIDRKEFDEKEETVFKAFDILCFKGNYHSKRGEGLKIFPIHILFNIMKVIDLVDFVNYMFKKRYNQETPQKI